MSEKTEQVEDDPCFIEYVEEELICENQQQDDIETDDDSEYKSSAKYEDSAQTIYNCELCSKTFGTFINLL